MKAISNNNNKWFNTNVERLLSGTDFAATGSAPSIQNTLLQLLLLLNLQNHSHTRIVLARKNHHLN